MLLPEKGFSLIPTTPSSLSFLLLRLAVAIGMGLRPVLRALGGLVRDGDACIIGLGSGGF